MECMIYLTHACNLECSYCYEGKEKSNEYISQELINPIIDYILGINGNQMLSISFLGGEPLLNVDWIYSFIEELESRNINNVKYKTTTNGVLLNEKIIEYFKNKKFDISISIDGNKESNNLNRKPKLPNDDYYNKVITNIKYMSDNKIPFNGRITVATNTVSNLYNNVKYLYNLGVEKINIGIDRFADWNRKKLDIYNKELEKIDNYYLDKRLKKEEITIDIYDKKFGFFIPKRKIQFCSAGSKNHIVINSLGDIYPCSFVTNNKYWKIGNVVSGIDDIQLYNNILGSLCKNTKCKECDIAYCCIGTRCGFYNYTKNGYLNKIDEITCGIERITNYHSKKVFDVLLKKGDPQILEMIKYCKENNIEMII